MITPAVSVYLILTVRTRATVMAMAKIMASCSGTLLPSSLTKISETHMAFLVSTNIGKNPDPSLGPHLYMPHQRPRHQSRHGQMTG